MSPAMMKFFRRTFIDLMFLCSLMASWQRHLIRGTTQEDPLAMVMYAIGILPLIHHLNQFSVHQVWYADDATALGKLSTIRSSWEDLQCHVALFGYYANPTK